MNKRPPESKIENNACVDDHVQKIINPISTGDDCIEEKSSNKVQGLERAISGKFLEIHDFPTICLVCTDENIFEFRK